MCVYIHTHTHIQCAVWCSKWQSHTNTSAVRQLPFKFWFSADHYGHLIPATNCKYKPSHCGYFWGFLNFYYWNSDPPLVLHLPLSLTYWASWCYHHGHLFNNCWTLYTIFWHNEVSLHHHYTPNISWQWIQMGETRCNNKTVWQYKFIPRTNFPMSLPSQINMTDSCAIYCMYQLQVLPPTIPPKVTD